MKCIPGEKLAAMALAFSIQISEDCDADEILALSDFLGMVTANLITIADRRQFIEDPANNCKIDANPKRDN